jgi:Tol biopolymer transport system component/N-acetylneuraminic acid mutarotase
MFTFLLLATLAFAQEMVFMREDAHGKNIFKLSGDKLEQISGDFKNNLYPDISSDGKNIVFVAGDNLNQLKIVMISQTQKILFEISNANNILHPQFSHDGESLFFSMKNKNKNKIGFFKFKDAFAQVPSINIINGENYLVYNFKAEQIEAEGDLFFPNPSSDRNFVVYHETLNGKKNVYINDRLNKTTNFIDEGMAPSLSFDERYIAYTKNINENWDIHLFDRFEKKKMKLTSNVSNDFAPTFNPNGDLIFASNRNGTFQIFKMKKENFGQEENVENLVFSSADDYAPKFSGEVHWKTKKLMDFPTPARSSFGALFHEGKVYMAGGHQGREHTYPPESFSSQLDILDLATGDWKTASPKIFPCHGFTLAGFGKYIYAFGGFAYNADYKPKWHSLNVVERYDIEKDLWEVITTMPRKRSSNVSIKVENHVFLIGGWDSTPKFENDIDGKFHSEIDVFDLVSESFHTSNIELPAPKRRAFTGVEHKGEIYLIGGIGEGGSHFKLLDKITKFSPSNAQFSELNPLPNATFAPAAGILDNELLVFGGMFKIDEMNYEYVSHIYAQDLKSQNWRHTGRSLKESKGFSQVVKTPEGLVILGGHTYQDNADAPVRTVELFTK